MASGMLRLPRSARSIARGSVHAWGTGGTGPASPSGTTCGSGDQEFSRLGVETLYIVTPVEIPGIGHMGPVTHPEEINAATEAHFDRLAGASE